MGGASQGREGVVMGGRRQITSAGPYVPTLREKEDRRKQEVEEAEARRSSQEADEEREKQRQEEELWLRKEEELRKHKKLEEEAAEQARKDREARERERITHERRELQEKERMVREAEERQRREDAENRSRFEEEHRQQDRHEYDKFTRETTQNLTARSKGESGESERIRDLERQLEEARARERQTLLQKQRDAMRTPSPHAKVPSREIENEAVDNERELLRKAWSDNNSSSTRPLPNPSSNSRPVPQPPSSKPVFSTLAAQRQREMQDEDDTEHTLAQETTTLEAAPPATPPRGQAGGSPLSGTRWGSRWSGQSRIGSVLQKSGSSAGTSSIVQREMEQERQRQREWEATQAQQAEDRKLMTDKELKDASDMPWDIHQYG